MLELISIGVSCLVLVVVPDSQKYNDKVYDPKLGYPYQYFKGEVLSDEEVRYRCRLMYLMFSVSVSQAVVPYASSVMLPPPTGVTNIEQIIDYEIRQGNNVENDQTSGKIIQTGNGTSLEFEQEVYDTSSNDLDKIILVKDDGILPGADGFPLNNNPRRRHPFGRPRMRGRGINIDPPPNIQGLGNIPEAPKVRSFTEVDTGLNAQRGNRGDQCPASKFNMYAEHQNFLEEMKSKGHFVDDIDCDLERFEELSTNPETDLIDRKSINEAKTILQSEQKNLVFKARRPNLNEGEPNLDFVVDGPGSYKYVDVKNPIDPRKFPPAKKKPESFNKMAKRIGEKIKKQKGGSDKVLHIVDLEQIPSEVKENITKKIIEGAGSPKDIKFIN